MLVDLRGSVNVTGHAVGEHGGTPPGGWSHLPPRRQAACHHREQHRAEIDGSVRTAERSGVEPCRGALGWVGPSYTRQATTVPSR